MSGNKDLVEYLIGKGIAIHAKTGLNYTVLHLAAKSGNKDLVEYLIGKGIDIHAKASEN